MASDQLRAALRWRTYRSRVGSRLEGSPWGSDISDSCETVHWRNVRSAGLVPMRGEAWDTAMARSGLRCVPSGSDVGRDMRAPVELPIVRRKTIFARSIEP